MPQDSFAISPATHRHLTLPAGFIAPCLPMMAPQPPTGPQWLHEIKHDGCRVVARNDGRRVRLYGRTGDDLTGRFPLIVDAMARLPPCTIDGEAVARDECGNTSLKLICQDEPDDRVFLFAFDLIELSGVDRRRDPLASRKLDLCRLLLNSGGPGLMFNGSIDGSDSDGATVFEHACRLGVEGIVSKRKDSRYISGRSPYWLKMMNPESEAARREIEETRAREAKKREQWAREAGNAPRLPARGQFKADRSDTIINACLDQLGLDSDGAKDEPA